MMLKPFNVIWHWPKGGHVVCLSNAGRARSTAAIGRRAVQLENIAEVAEDWRRRMARAGKLRECVCSMKKLQNRGPFK